MGVNSHSLCELLLRALKQYYIVQRGRTAARVAAAGIHICILYYCMVDNFLTRGNRISAHFVLRTVYKKLIA